MIYGGIMFRRSFIGTKIRAEKNHRMSRFIITLSNQCCFDVFITKNETTLTTNCIKGLLGLSL